MARKVGKLSALAVAQTKRRGYYSDGGGLFLQVSASGAKSWVFRFKEAGRLREMGLGPLHTVSLAEARQKALECRKLRLDHLDPIAARRAARPRQTATMTFDEAAEQYIAGQEPGWRDPRAAGQWRASLRDHVFPVFGGMPVSAVDLPLVLKAIEPMWATKTVTAKRVR